MIGHYWRADRVSKRQRTTRHPGRYGLFVAYADQLRTRPDLTMMVESANDVPSLIRAAGCYKPALCKWIGGSVRIPEFEEAACANK